MVKLSGLAATGATLAGTAFPSRAVANPRGPAIFYIPHQDDEAIGMAGTILREKAAGRQVYIVLLSNGQNDALRQIMNSGPCFLGPKCPAPGQRHDLKWAEGGDDVVKARNAEFALSAQRLGADRVFTMQIPDTPYGDPVGAAQTPNFSNFVASVQNVIRNFARDYPNASHKLAAGWLDGNLTHKACSDAAHSLRGEIPDLMFNHIYTYARDPIGERARSGCTVVSLSKEWMAIKRQALDAYRIWDPAQGFYALGYHSVPEWFDNAATDPREFTYPLPALYRTGPAGVWPVGGDVFGSGSRPGNSQGHWTGAKARSSTPWKPTKPVPHDCCAPRYDPIV